jgi:transcriptional regulator with XRE-family HTH domain
MVIRYNKKMREEIMKNVKAPDRVDAQVGRRIRVYRLTLGMSQTTLAKALGVSFQQIQKYEKGMNRVGAGRLTNIAKVLGVPVTTLLGADDSAGHPRTGKEASSPLDLLSTPNVMKLLHAYSKLSDGRMRRLVVLLVEHIAAARDQSSKGD